MKVFYIAPHYFDSEFDVKLTIIKRIANEDGIEIVKGVHTGEKEFDLEKTMELYKEVTYFIADLSFERPSCYYEIGYVQGMNKEVDLIALKGTMIHQVRGEVNFYSNIYEYEALIKHLIKEIKRKAVYKEYHGNSDS